MRDKRALYWMGMAVSLMALTGCSFIINRMAFFPDRHFRAPLPEKSREVVITTSDGIRLVCLYLEKVQSDKIVLYFHGNAGNIYHRLSDLAILRAMGFNVLGLSYRGYGKSKGRISERGAYLDGAATLAFALDELGFKPHNTYLLGRSIGSTVAVHIAQNRELGGMILVTPLSSAREVARKSGFGFLSRLAGEAFDNLTKIGQLQAPLLVIHGTHDEVIPYELGRALYAQAPSPKQFVSIPDANHNNLSDVHSPQYWPPIQRFLNNPMPKPPSGGTQ